MTDSITRLSTALGDRYRVERELGAGGMATVYLAHDGRHDRRVALKVLRPELSAILGADRFLHEIKTTANLQHPHILPLHDSGEADGIVYYVMPYVEGESLRDRLTREHQLPVEEAVRIAREVADALDYAHRHGVVHRDIKPENVLLHDGRAQVADFGIALAVSTAGGGTRMTETGMSLGTPHYMAPEQAMGEREITPRADIYALGCVLYEMLVGEPPFTGPTAQAIIARVVTEEPRSLTLQRRTIPPHVEAAVRKALEKLPADRFQSAAECAEALGNPAFDAAPAQRGTVAPTPRLGPAVPRSRAAAAIAPWALATVGLALGAWGLFRPRPRPVPPPVVQFARHIPPGDTAFLVFSGPGVAVSPRGDRVVYASTGAGLQMWGMDQMAPAPVGGTRNAYAPFFSPDGAWIGYAASNRIWRVPVSGGAPVAVADLPAGTPMGTTSWGPNDTIVFSSGGRLWSVPASGGVPDTLLVADSTETLVAHPEHLDTRTVLFTYRLRDQSDHLGMLDLATRRVTRFPRLAGSNPHYVEPGFVLLANQDGTIVAVPFDRGRLEPTGAPIPFAQGVLVGAGGNARMGVSRAGAVAFMQGVTLDRELALVDLRGRVLLTFPERRNYEAARFSPDGRRIAVTLSSAGTGAGDIWVADIRQTTLERLTFDGGGRPVWTPDGRWIIYARGGDLWRIPSDGSGTAESLLVAPNTQWPHDVTPDGRGLVYREIHPQTLRDIWVMPLAGDSAPRPILRTPFEDRAPALSPDGRWMAYGSNESGREEIYVRPFPGPGPRVQVSLDGGIGPRWTPDGRGIVYRLDDRFMLATVRTRPEFSVERRAEMFRGNYLDNSSVAMYDVAPDGRRMVVQTQVGGSSGTMVVVLNWFANQSARAAPAAAP